MNELNSVLFCSDESKYEWKTTVKAIKPYTVIEGKCAHCAIEDLKAKYQKALTALRKIKKHDWSRHTEDQTETAFFCLRELGEKE